MKGAHCGEFFVKQLEVVKGKINFENLKLCAFGSHWSIQRLTF
jgi:hypothetical protein